MSERPSVWSRRRALAACGLAVWQGTRAAAAAGAAPPTGWLTPPLPAPALGLWSADGRPVVLSALLSGHVTALQLMFTGCHGSCPVQGALFAELATRLARSGSGVQLLSVSVDALGDTPATLSQWQARFGRAPGWRCAVPAAADVAPLSRYLRGVATAGDVHSSQVFVFDAQGRLSYRTGDAPALGWLEALLAEQVRRT